VGRKKDTYHHKADASVENAYSATPLGISRRVFRRAFEVEWFAHCRLSVGETLAPSFGKVARYPASGREPNCRCGVVWVHSHSVDCDEYSDDDSEGYHQRPYVKRRFRKAVRIEYSFEQRFHTRFPIVRGTTSADNRLALSEMVNVLPTKSARDLSDCQITTLFVPATKVLGLSTI
jgi:hypothetical protein